MNKVSAFIRTAYIEERNEGLTWSKDLIVFLLTLGAIFSCLGVAYLLVSGNWIIATALVFIIPAFVLLVRVPYIALILWMVLSPFLVQTPTVPERQVYWLIHRLLPVFTLLILVLLSILKISNRQLPRLGIVDFAMIGYVVVSVSSIILQSNTTSATLIHYYDRTFIPFCLYWVVTFIAPRENKLKWLVPIALYIVITQVVIGTISWIAPSLLRSEWLDYVGIRTTGSLGSPGVYSTSLIFAGMVIFYTSTRMKPSWKRTMLQLAFLASIYGVFITFSRASWLAGILVLLGVFVLYPKYLFNLTLKALPIIIIFAGTFLATQLEYAKTRFYSEESAHSALSRLPVLVAAYRMFEQKPIFGWGYGNFDQYDRQFQGRFGDLVNPVEKDLTSHNAYLTILAEQGVVGLFLFTAPILLLLVQTLRQRSRLSKNGLMSKKMLSLYWLVILSYFIVISFSPMVVVFGLSLQWITLGLIANILNTRRLIK